MVYVQTTAEMELSVQVNNVILATISTMKDVQAHVKYNQTIHAQANHQSVVI